jgi:hypothetical protein
LVVLPGWLFLCKIALYRAPPKASKAEATVPLNGSNAFPYWSRATLSGLSLWLLGRKREKLFLEALKCPDYLAAGGDFSFSIADLLQNRAAPFVEQKAFVRQAEPSRTPVSKPHAKPGFQGGKAAAYGSR